MLETWKSYGYTRDGVRFVETVMVWDTAKGEIVESSTRYLLPKDEVEGRILAISPLKLERAI